MNDNSPIILPHFFAAFVFGGLGYLNGGSFVLGGANLFNIKLIMLSITMLSLESVRFS